MYLTDDRIPDLILYLFNDWMVLCREKSCVLIDCWEGRKVWHEGCSFDRFGPVGVDTFGYGKKVGGGGLWYRPLSKGLT